MRGTVSFKYDPDRMIDPEEWLALDDDERSGLPEGGPVNRIDPSLSRAEDIGGLTRDPTVDSHCASE